MSSKHHKWVEFEGDMWTLRAVLCERLRYDDEGERMDIWMWFASLGQDEWFAHAVSSDVGPKARETIFASIDGEEMDVMLAYAGEPWETIIEEPVGVGNMHRAVVNAINPGLMSDLKRMSRSEIVSLRSIEEGGLSFM